MVHLSKEIKLTMKQSKNLIAVITMMFLFGMIAFVTNLAAPIGVVWKNSFIDSGNANTIGMLGNAMNFLAYFFMGIPSGRMLAKIGYKKTALCGIAVGIVGLVLQFLSGLPGEKISGFIVYLAGAFVCGFSVCMLNTVVNPMTNQLGGGGNKGNQLNLIGGTVNSLTGTLTPMFVGMLIGTVTKNTHIEDINIVLYVAMAVFAASFLVLLRLPIENPEQSESEVSDAVSPLRFRHFKLGAMAIFLYVGVEVGIPGTLFFYLSDTTSKGIGAGHEKAAAIAGFAAATYWFLMLVGRFVAGFIAGKVSSRKMLVSTSFVGILLIFAAIVFGESVTVMTPVFTGSGIAMYNMPVGALLLVLCGLCTSVMWSCIFNLSVEGLGRSTALASGIFMMMVVGGGVMPLVQNQIADHLTYMASYCVPLLSLVYILYYGINGSRIENNKNR